jgi:gas vesicle protein
MANVKQEETRGDSFRSRGDSFGSLGNGFGFLGAAVWDMIFDEDTDTSPDNIEDTDTSPDNIEDDGTPWMPIIDNESEEDKYTEMFNEQQQAYQDQLKQMQLANQTQMQQMQNMFEMSMQQMTNQMSALRTPITPETKRPSIILGDSRSIRSMALR